MSTANRTIPVDGNAIAGTMLDILGVDVTAMTGTCRSCGAVAVIAQAVVEIDAHAAIVRCRACTRTLFTVWHPPAPRIVFGTLGALAAGLREEHS